ncbi:integrase [Amycolatopsis sp. GM8]|uniref:integrase n=1 Tax=Amycolatopsis sp. GM8 TaxID=2896530 RepID=UPI001F224068|nr:integrase [Amycolatopsis sp. GM8]
MDLEDSQSVAQVRFLIRDRDAKYSALIDDILRGAGISTVLTRCPDPAHERDHRTLGEDAARRTAGSRTDLERTHLRQALREYQRRYNPHRTHRSLAAAAPLRTLPLESDRIDRLAVHRLGGIIHKYRHAA